MTWWPALAAAYAASGNEDYFREWRYEMVRWAEDLLPFTAKTPHFVKRGMETYGRCERMIEVLPRMIRSRNFDAKTLLYFLASFHEQADHIPRVYAKTGNHRLGELTQVFKNEVTFPEFKRAEAWRNDGLTLLPRMIDDDVYDDGMNKELVFSYHSMYVGLFMEVWTQTGMELENQKEGLRPHGLSSNRPDPFPGGSAANQGGSLRRGARWCSRLQDRGSGKRPGNPRRSCRRNGRDQRAPLNSSRRCCSAVRPIH